MHRLVTILVLSVTLVSGPAGAEPVSAQKPWSRHCTTQGIPASDDKEAVYLETAATRCEPKDACVLSCSRSGCAEDIAGGCFHACRGIQEEMAERADSWEAGPSCRLPPNNSFKPTPHRGGGHVPALR
jgi:hypothetical protein